MNTRLSNASYINLYETIKELNSTPSTDTQFSHEEQVSEEDIALAKICLHALSSMDSETMSIFESYLITNQIQAASIILEASILETTVSEGFEDLIKGTATKYLNKTDSKAAMARDGARAVTDFLKKPSNAEKVKRAVGDEITDTMGSIKRLMDKSKKPENKAGFFTSKADKDELDKFQKLKDFKQVGKVAAIAVGVGIAAWAAVKGGKALYKKLKGATADWKSGSADKDPKKLAAAAQTMATVMKKAPPAAMKGITDKVVAPAVSQQAKKTAEPKSGEKSGGGKSSGGGNPDNWGGKRKDAGRPEGS